VTSARLSWATHHRKWPSLPSMAKALLDWETVVMVDHVVLAVKPPLTDAELNTLFAAAWPSHSETRFGPVLGRSLTWVAARLDERLVGFVNVATDGGAHAFVLDTTVHPDVQRRGVGRRLVTMAVEHTRQAGVEWLHVDYEPHLDGFYRGCGFRPTAAGLLRLN
jgi:ribosomal protein S18 acetylase RimI-like enzyme